MWRTWTHSIFTRRGLPVSRVWNTIIGIDQTANGATGGNPDTTISGRIFYNRSEGNGKYWVAIEKFVNFIFYLLDGPGHCLQAYSNDTGETYHDANWLDKLFIAIFCVLGSAVVIVIAWPVCILIKIYKSVMKRF